MRIGRGDWRLPKEYDCSLTAANIERTKCDGFDVHKI
jgi:hypothetical protein